MKKSDFVVRFAGEGGQGLLVTAEGFAKANTQAGYHAQTFATFPSQITGGPTWMQARIATTPILSRGDDLDVLVVFNREAYETHRAEVKDTGVIIYDSSEFSLDDDGGSLGITFEALAKSTGNNRAANMVVMGALTYLVNMRQSMLEEFVVKRFTRGRPNDDEIIKSNIQALSLGRDEAVGKASVLELMQAVDDHIPQPDRPIDKPFLMPIEDVFSISGRGTVVTGRIERGVVKVGEEIEIVGIKDTEKTTCTGVEMFRKLLDEGEAGDNVGVLLRGTKREEVERGQVLAKPGSITPHTKFTCEAYILTKDEGGRHTPFFGNYRPQFYFRTTDVTGTVVLPEGTEMVMPGDNVTMDVEMIAPIAMEDGLRFAIREGGRTVGAGVVAKVIE